MSKFAWPVFFASAAAVVTVSIIGGLLFKKFLNPKTQEVESKFIGSIGADGLKGYQNITH